jgi:hypothetical protein
VPTFVWSTLHANPTVVSFGDAFVGGLRFITTGLDGDPRRLSAFRTYRDVMPAPAVWTAMNVGLLAMLVLAPTRSGKTTRVVVPSLLDHRGPTIVLLNKTDVVFHTIPRAVRRTCAADRGRSVRRTQAARARRAPRPVPCSSRLRMAGWRCSSGRSGRRGRRRTASCRRRCGRRPGPSRACRQADRVRLRIQLLAEQAHLRIGRKARL